MALVKPQLGGHAVKPQQMPSDIFSDKLDLTIRQETMSISLTAQTFAETVIEL